MMPTASGQIGELAVPAELNPNCTAQAGACRHAQAAWHQRNDAGLAFSAKSAEHLGKAPALMRGQA